ncbi:hypothetical protein BCR44DRAFT_1265890 [Catenaria anguillulae PL171]|uniref:Uncharacterized protein n=1 Tax=Catenaria anguillulae PL171 TaxID=765915 RepID=A0A1Y2HC54_9FUNG|nr:hypothetical protein BCR44DRAFT_1265890 [Catenaria anguillulae PL171]
MQALASPVAIPVPPTPDMPAYPSPVALMRTYSSGYIDTASIPTNVSLYHAPPPPPMPSHQPHFVSAILPPPIDPSFVSIHHPPTAYSQAPRNRQTHPCAG